MLLAPALRALRPAAAGPHRWLLGLSAAGWAVVIATHLGSAGHAEHVGAGGHTRVAEAPAAATGDLSAGLAAWAVMSVAMMSPLAIPLSRHVYRSSLRRRRLRSVLCAAGAYLGTWAAAGVPVAAGARLVPTTVRAALGAALLLAAAAWLSTGLRGRLAARVPATVPLALRGRAADVAAARLGGVHAARCITTCGPVMAPMAMLAGHMHLTMMLVTAVVVTIDRLATSRGTRRACAPVLAAAAGAIAITIVG